MVGFQFKEIAEGPKNLSMSKCVWQYFVVYFMRKGDYPMWSVAQHPKKRHGIMDCSQIVEGLKCQAEDFVFNSIGKTELYSTSIQNLDS